MGKWIEFPLPSISLEMVLPNSGTRAPVVRAFFVSFFSFFLNSNDSVFSSCNLTAENCVQCQRKTLGVAVRINAL